MTNDVTFSIGGTDVTDDLLEVYGVLLGGDLSGSYSKAFITAGAGAHIRIAGPLIGDVSYRYGHIGAEPDSELAAISTHRLQFGVGVRF